MRLAILAIFAAPLAAASPVHRVVPNFRDLTIKLRETHGLSHAMIHTSYFKGPRERKEILPEGAKLMGPGSSILQCDLRTVIHLRPNSKTYTSFSGPTERDPSRPVRVRPQPEGPIVNLTMDSVDTGERRTVAGYEARHLKSTITIQPSKDAATQPGKVQLDTWYLDLPGESCLDAQPRSLSSIFMGMFKVGPTGRPDHFDITYTGVQPTGFILEERSTQREGGNVILNKTELLEVSEQPLDESLFEIPPDYTQKQRPLPNIRIAAPVVETHPAPQ